MADREKKQGDGEEDLKIKDKSPLSSMDWVMFLSGEIRHREMKQSMSESIVAVVISIIAVMVAAAFTFSFVYFAIVACCYLLILLMVLVVFRWIYNRRIKSAVDELKKLRGEVITGSLTNSDEILECWGKNEIWKKR